MEHWSGFGLCSVFNDFVPNIAGLSHHATITWKSSVYHWRINGDKMTVLLMLESRLQEIHSFSFMLQDNRTFVADKRKKQIRRVLLQKQLDSTDTPEDSCPPRLKISSLQPTPHLETVSLWCRPLSLLQPYLKACQFTINTDHDALKWILNWRARPPSYCVED